MTTATPWPGVTATRHGHEVALTGNTFPAKDQIRATGFRWHAATKTWRAPATLLTRLTADTPAPATAAPAYPPTPEQTAILDAVATGRTVVVEALAGTGKTSTLELIAEAHPGRRILLVVFNKSMQSEASRRMPGNVESRTFDSLGWTGAPAWATDKFRAQRDNADTVIRRLTDIVTHLDLHRSPVKYAADIPHTVDIDGDIVTTTRRETVVVQPVRVASAALRAVEAWCNSADLELDARHVPAITEGEGHDAAAAAILPYAIKVWDDITAPKGRLRITNGHITKMWALTHPDLTVRGTGPRTVPDLVLIDEAQDTAPVCEAVMTSQTVQTVWVGDSWQSIYGFRGAANALANVEPNPAERLPLTKSWRFGPEIAAAGNTYLRRLGARWTITGGGTPGTVTRSGAMTDPDVVLCRTNAGMIGEVVKLMAAGRTAAVTPGTRTDLAQLVATVRYLQGTGEPPGRIHDDLAAFGTWAEVDTAVASGEADPKVEMIHRLFTEYGLARIAQVVASLTDIGRASATAVAVITAHKAKGLQWHRVRIGGDFPQPRTRETGVTYPGPDELKLAYVAVTRARTALDPGSLDWALTPNLEGTK